MTNDLRPEALHERITGTWGRSLSVKDSTTSTMDDALAAAAEGASDGHVELADHQTRGRGAHGRQWVSPPGTDLYFSVLARKALMPADFDSRKVLKDRILGFQRHYQKVAAPFDWKFTRQDLHRLLAKCSREPLKKAA